MTDRPLRIAVVARAVYPIHGRGGLERSVYDLTRHLASAGHEVTIVTQPPFGAAVDPAPGAPALAGGRPRIAYSHVPYRTFPFAGRRGTTVIDRSTAYPLFGLRAGRRAWELVQSGRADIVHGFGASALGYARRRWSAQAPLVLNPQGLEEFGATDPGRARLKRAAYFPLQVSVRICARAADCVIATDRSLEPAVLAHLHVPRERVRVLPNALDLGEVDRQATPDDGARMRARAAIRGDDRLLLSVGRLEQNKGFQVLAAALAGLRGHSGPIAEDRWRWVIVGGGPFESPLRAIVAKAGLTERVLFAGRASDADLHAWYEAADLFVHPTLYEGSSLVTLEAMAHRRAVVATRAGGLPDKVKPGLNGWLVAPGDAAALAAAISGALASPERLASMGLAGRRIVEEEFSWASVGADTIRLYRELLERRVS